MAVGDDFEMALDDLRSGSGALGTSFTDTVRFHAITRLLPVSFNSRPHPISISSSRHFSSLHQFPNTLHNSKHSNKTTDEITTKPSPSPKNITWTDRHRLSLGVRCELYR